MPPIAALLDDAPSAFGSTKRLSPDLTQHLAHVLHTIAADVLPAEVLNILGISTEYAGWLILSQDDLLAVHVNFQGVLLSNVQGSPEFDRQDDAPELVYSTYNPR
jgi:hypothetical protein